MLSGTRSDSVVRSQIWCSLPNQQFQSLGSVPPLPRFLAPVMNIQHSINIILILWSKYACWASSLATPLVGHEPSQAPLTCAHCRDVKALTPRDHCCMVEGISVYESKWSSCTCCTKTTARRHRGLGPTRGHLCQRARSVVHCVQNRLKCNMLLLVHLFNGLFSRTTWVSQHQTGKPFWFLLEQEMMGWQWHQLDHIQIICTSLQTDNHASTSPLSFYRPNAVHAAQPTTSKHWRHKCSMLICSLILTEWHECGRIFWIFTRWVENFHPKYQECDFHLLKHET